MISLALDAVLLLSSEIVEVALRVHSAEVLVAAPSLAVVAHIVSDSSTEDSPKIRFLLIELLL
jgi:hypothetical protein